MDENKRRALADIGYTILPVCGSCEHSAMPPASDWGVCKLFQYNHIKHTGVPRLLSVHRSGTCPRFSLNPEVEASLHGFREFLNDPSSS